ncbi:MAG: ATP synthase F1 subunit gamma [Clostridiales bacterium]|jgi:F-type H+-transporting ATPase subunit gamma|nr:ATP synthase F1 subunit gamma [Clostridiales bacterium]
MASTRSIKRRIRSIGSTQQITRAMNLVAASKLQRAKAKLESVRPYFEETQRLVFEIASNIDAPNLFFTPRQVKHTGYIIITGDRGLCGGYNVNVSKLGYELIHEREKHSERIIAVGVKSRDYFRRRRKQIIRTYQGISEIPFYEDAAEIGEIAVDLFDSGEVDEVYLIYTQFISTLAHTPTAIKLLPLVAEKGRQNRVIDYEPDEEGFLSYLVPKYLSAVIFGALAESAACEQGARMASMDAATKNSSELIDKLTLRYNRVRQDAITQELTEIVSGADALT